MSKQQVAAAAEAAKNLPAIVTSFEEDAGGGFENTSMEDYALPRLTVLQKMSPQCDPDQPGEYMDTAKPGMLYDTVNRELFDGEKGVTVLPVFFKRAFLEWVPRNSGGGFVAEYPPEVGEELLRTCSKGDKGQDVLPNGNELQDTRTHYVFVVRADGTWQPFIISLASTQGKKSKQWMTGMRSLTVRGSKGPFNPPMWGQLWVANTVPESNEKGSWRGWKFSWLGTKEDPAPGLVQDPDMYAAAKAFREQIAAGQTKADYEVKPTTAAHDM